MASNIPGFEYDIFISYRHNDNRSGWVREFVHQLSEELAATLKENVSIYFDENPHDGLRETDNVDDSLRDKLKCLIFIPILSQTYCDPKSFAWSNEFLVFKRTASEDAIGLKVKLANTNTTSRILPIRIHDLDAEDLALIENEIGPLRSVDFIFKSIGVNRPLMPTDNPDKNQNRTFYRDQVNKVANCIKEIIGGLKGGTKQVTNSRQDQTPVIQPLRRKKIAVAAGIILFLSIASFLVYHFSQAEPDKLDRSIAVLAFDDLSQNHDQEYFSDGISEELINALVKIEGLKVPSRTSSFWFKGKGTDPKEIGEKLDVALIVEGSVRKSGDKLRITAQLIDARNGYHLWSETYDHDIKDIFKAQDDVTKGIVRQLRQRLSIEGMISDRKLPTKNLEAYDLYLRGHKFFMMKGKHVYKARELLLEAVRLDPDFANAHAALAEAYAVYDLGFGDHVQAIASANRALALDSTLSSPYAVIAWSDSAARSLKSFLNMKDMDNMHSNFKRAIASDPQNSTAHLWYGINLARFGQYNQAFDQMRIAIETDPMVAVNYGALGFMETLHGDDSIGLSHLKEGVRLGWAAGYQRLALYYLDHQQWENAEKAFTEHALLTPMSGQMDHHQLVNAIRQKDIMTVRKILEPLDTRQGFVVGFKSRIAGIVGDYERVEASLADWGVAEGMRPMRKELRKREGFLKFVKENGYVQYWNKYGWPDVCFPVGENDFGCN